MIRSFLELALSRHLPVVLLLVKISIVFGLGFLLARLLRHRSAELRHFLWVTTLLGALAIPLITFVAPRLEWAILSPPPLPTIVSNVYPSVSSGPLNDRASNDPLPASIEPAPSSSGLLSLTRIWLIGALLVALWCAIGHLALVRMARRARPVTDSSWLALLEETATLTQLGHPVRLLTSPSIDSPMTWGLRRPIVLLPEAASEWTLERRRVVLLHELAHIARMDFMVQLLASITCALYWFHPAVWGAARRLRHESEHACDDRAITSGTPAADYASHLLCLALQSKGRHWHEAMAVGLTRPSTLEARVRAVLDEGLTRKVLSTKVRVAASIVLGAFVFLLAALTPVRAALSTAVLEGPTPYKQTSETNVETAVESTEEAEAAASEQEVQKAEAMSDAADRATTVVSRTVQAAPGERLDMRLEAGGDVNIEGWDEPEVRVLARINGPDADKINVDVDRTANGVQVKASFARHSRVQTSSNEFDIKVPRKFDLRLHSSGGGLRMSHVEGTFEGNTGGGEIVLEHVKGRASLSTGGSDIRVTDSHLDGEVSTGGGTVNFIGVKGGLIGSSGSGEVMSHESMEGADLEAQSEKLAEMGADLTVMTESQARNAEEMSREASKMSSRADELAAKAAEISKSGGSVVLDEIRNGATISTGGGDVQIGKTAGPVVVSTGGGNMEIGPVSGSLDASTGAGDIQVQVVTTKEAIELSSGSGKITLDIPASFDGRIELETAYTKSFGRATKIDSEWRLERETTTNWDGERGTPRRYVRAHATLGDGRGLVRVTTVNGDIILHRAKQ